MDTRSIDNYTDLLQEAERYQHIIIYGVGGVGKTVYNYLSSQRLGTHIYDFAVTITENNFTEYKGVKVTSIGELSEYASRALVLVAVKKHLQQQLLNELGRYGFQNIILIDEMLYYHLMNDNISKDTVIQEMQNEIDKLRSDVRKLSQQNESNSVALIKIQQQPCFPYMVLNILDHCNLRCQGCDHFACIAEERFIALESIRKDVKRIAEITGGSITKIGVMGGEPLLHPDLQEILLLVREYLPDTDIRLTTNGLLLLKQQESFWELCRNNRITIVNTKYPVNIDYNKIEAIAKEQGVTYKYFEGTGGDVCKTSYKKSIDIYGNQNSVSSFMQCSISNYGSFLMEGKMYGCPFIGTIRIFNEKFEQKLRLDETDYIDIHKEGITKAELLKFAATPHAFCRYCDIEKRKYGIPWKRSKGDIYEWLVTPEEQDNERPFHRGFKF